MHLASKIVQIVYDSGLLLLFLSPQTLCGRPHNAGVGDQQITCLEIQVQVNYRLLCIRIQIVVIQKHQTDFIYYLILLTFHSRRQYWITDFNLYHLYRVCMYFCLQLQCCAPVYLEAFQIICAILLGLASKIRTALCSSYVQKWRFMIMWHFPSMVIIT